MFFEEESHQRMLVGYLQKVGQEQISEVELRERANRTAMIVGTMRQTPKDWDSLCAFNIKYIGTQFIGSLSNFDAKNERSINDAYSMAFRFLCEFSFNLPEGKELGFELAKVQREILDDGTNRNDEVGLTIRYAAYQMPVRIAKEILNDPRLSNLRDAAKVVSDAQNTMSAWRTEMAASEARVGALESALKTYEHGFNFVGLYQGFSGLLSAKKQEKRRLLYLLVALATAIISPLAIHLILVYQKVSSSESIGQTDFAVWLPIASIVFVLIYYFRIVLQNYRSVLGQILQIELRMTLCQFIQSYIDYAKDIEGSGIDTLRKFEGVVFSNVQVDPEKMPSTFDGLEQLAALVKSLRGGA